MSKKKDKKYRCDMRWCKNKATNFYHKGAFMGYHYSELPKGDILKKRGEWLCVCDRCDKLMNQFKAFNQRDKVE